MKKEAYLHRFALIDNLGIYCMHNSYNIKWNSNQSDPLQIQRDQVHEQPMLSFGKLQPADKLAFSVASLVLNDYKALDENTTGICMGTEFGSLSTDLGFMESIDSGFPRPAYFSATLPSSPVAEIAIQYKLKGPNRVYVGGNTSDLTAFESAVTLLDLKKSGTILLIWVNALDSNDRNSPIVKNKETKPKACAMLLSKNKLEQPYTVKISLEGNFSPSINNIPVEKSYFRDIANAIEQKQAIRLELPKDLFEGYLTISKE